MNIQQALAKVINSESLARDEMQAVMKQIMTGEATPAQIGGFLVAMRMKGETVEELTAAVSVMRELATPVSINVDNLVDTCGTGGDGAHLFNVSTASAFVVAASGAHVAKHGNRSVSSSTGSADVLEEAGVKLTLPPQAVASAISDVGVGFLFAQAHHSAMKHAIGPRKELAQRTLFNILGPMTNPAGVKRQVIGVYDKSLCRPMAEVLKNLGSEHVLIVHAADGLDEFSVASDNVVAELRNGEIKEYQISAADFSLSHENLEGLSVQTAAESLALIKNVFNGKSDVQTEKAADMIALNAGAAIYVSGVAGSFAHGVAMAQDAISTGMAGEKLKQLVEFSQCH